MCGFGVALILFCYCCSFLFRSSEKSVKYFTLINFAVSFLLPLVKFLRYEELKNVVLWLIEHFYPLYSLQMKFSPNTNLNPL